MSSAAIGAGFYRVSAERTEATVAAACRAAIAGAGQTVLLALPLDVQRAVASAAGPQACEPVAPAPLPPLGPLIDALARARRPVFAAELIDAKIVSSHPSWWLEDAVRGH